MDIEEFQNRWREDYYSYLAKPVLIAVAMVVVGTLINSFVAKNDFIIPILVGVSLFAYFGKMVFPSNPGIEIIQRTQKILKGREKERRHPDKYVYLDRSRIEKFYSYYMKEEVLVSKTTSDGGSLSGAIHGGIASIEGTREKSESLNFSFLPERLFEAIEEKLIAEYPHPKSKQDIVNGKTCWIEGTFTSAYNPEKGSIQLTIIKNDDVNCTLDSQFLSSKYAPSYALFALRNLKIRALGDIVSLSNSTMMFIPIVIVQV